MPHGPDDAQLQALARKVQALGHVRVTPGAAPLDVLVGEDERTLSITAEFDKVGAVAVLLTSPDCDLQGDEPGHYWMIKR